MYRPSVGPARTSLAGISAVQSYRAANNRPVDPAAEGIAPGRLGVVAGTALASQTVPLWLTKLEH